MSDLLSINSSCNGNGTDDLQPLLTANVAALKEGHAVLASLSDAHFTASCRPAFQSNLGAHFRHLLEHYICFLNAIQRADKVVCYDSRARDAKIERQRAYALRVSDRVVAELCEISLKKISALAAEQLQVKDQQTPVSVPTTVARELLFLQSHTVHHQAIIAAMCRVLGHSVPETFGVAIATRAFQAAQQACERRSQLPTEVTG